MSDPVVETVDLVAGYGAVPVVRSLDLTVSEGEIVAILGPNGAGKTTTLLTLAGVLRPIQGRVRVLDTDLAGKAPHQVARLGVAMVPEDRGLFYQLTVGENLRLRQRRGSPTGVDDVLSHFPALAPIMGRRAGLLSGGEQQMLAIAGALLLDPRILLLDEMSLGLAPNLAERLLQVVRSIANQRGIAVVLVEQNVHAALRVADRGYVLRHGEVAASGSVEDLRADVLRLENSYLGNGSRATEASSNGHG